ncbi:MULTISPECIES: CRISPR-associated helicase Cas3' [unclassified Proteiniphilum]|jgi:CRISPR-associated endonuclease/helicase Cas3|uniref:CRISPR-associated helicase Cas3' n=1 Tax=unclassified Proteiniphilum TaxID=2622718 RepID=UPI0025804964|nr:MULTISPECIES: CRISPR-associated helicase Cas3' [unclassified Proteiniphilum]
MEFYSHAIDTPQGRVGSKLLCEHLKNVKDLFYRGIKYLHVFDDKWTILENIAIFHDLGKYTQYFQDYLFNRPDVDYYLKSHSQFGALYFLARYFNNDPFWGIVGYWIISQHHGNLQSLMALRSDFTETAFNADILQLKKRQSSILPFKSIVSHELVVEDIETFHEKILPCRSYFKAIKQLQKNCNIQHYFLINYLFSLLIEADKLDASGTIVYQRVPLSPSKVDNDKGIPDQVWDETLSDFGHLSQNELRNLVRKRVIEKLSEKGIISQKIFTLTGPTGIGKTLTALDFALKLRAMIRKKEGREAQIIYALPFINIIEQADSVYRKLFDKNEARILSHYQYADALSQQEEYNDDGKGYNQKLMSLDTWQCDIVITTFVQFLQTLIGNRNKLLKKFNHYAGSIIILDEVQTIALKQLPLVGASLYYLSKFLDARIVLMTATKPKVFELANQKILSIEGEKANPIELLGTEKDVEKIFRSFHRTRLLPQIEKKIVDQEDFVENYFKKYWEPNKSCLIVVNTVKLSIDVFRSIQSYLGEKGLKNPIYYLSTNIVPAGRQQLIDQIKEDVINARLNKGLKPILISTQCIEAGVDLDFDLAFRDLAPIDSIIQVAGRVNREYNKDFVGEVIVIDFGMCGRIYGPMTEETARKAITHFTDIESHIDEVRYLDLVNHYYSHICERNDDGFEYSMNFFKSMKKLDYDGSEWSVAKFQVIENGFKTRSVFIECDEKATLAKEMFDKMIRKECSREDFEPYKRDFHQHIIAVPDYLDKLKELDELSDNILIVPYDSLKEYYSETGFIRNKIEDSWVTIL